MNKLRLTTPPDFTKLTAENWPLDVPRALERSWASAEIDMSATENMDSSGAEALLSVHRKFGSRGTRVQLVNAPMVVIHVLEALDLRSLFLFASRPAEECPETSRTILVVEDEVIIRSVVEMSLRPLGYSVLMVSNGMEALEIAHRENPVAIILDYVMPIMDGAAALRGLKSARSTRHIPVIIMTASEKLALEKSEHFDHAALVLRKPFSPSSFRNSVQRIIEESRQLAEVC
jgi:CheY-like chemotaxis protein/anti-anti-sigma regulatory factor